MNHLKCPCYLSCAFYDFMVSRLRMRISIWSFILYEYLKILNIIPGLIDIYKHIFGGLFLEGLTFRGHFVLVSAYLRLLRSIIISINYRYHRQRISFFKLNRLNFALNLSKSIQYLFYIITIAISACLERFRG